MRVIDRPVAEADGVDQQVQLARAVAAAAEPLHAAPVPVVDLHLDLLHVEHVDAALVVGEDPAHGPDQRVIVARAAHAPLLGQDEGLDAVARFGPVGDHGDFAPGGRGP